MKPQGTHTQLHSHSDGMKLSKLDGMPSRPSSKLLVCMLSIRS